MNNSVYFNGKIIGFKCSVCDGVFSKMWSTTCNSCREQKELKLVIKKILEQPEK